MYELLFIPLGISLAFNFAQHRHRSKKPAKAQSYEVTQLLNDLTTGSALVKVMRVDPANVFMRSARDLD